MTEQPDRPREEPVVNDRRRIDPETGRVRPPAAGGAGAAPEPGSGPGAAAGPDDAASVPGPDGAGQVPGEAPAAQGAGGPDAGAAGAAGSPDGAGDAGDAGSAGDADPLAQAQAEVLDLQDQVARRKADLYNVEQEYAAFVRRSRTEASGHRQAGVESVVESLFGVLDDVALARQHDDLTGPFASIADKLEQTLQQRFGLERFGAVGEEFDPTVHEALMSTDSAEVEVTTIDQVLQPGYRIGEKVVRAARVAVHSPA
ncbi:nucleotide exchange factor GrpE [Georgenia sp. Z1344]|uniref:nucleotide exchange factor GrpE n=1 Tax=Georgenia sp. Z1344 TaxID=3416706 RepID=UPI003CFB3DCB